MAGTRTPITASGRDGRHICLLCPLYSTRRTGAEELDDRVEDQVEGAFGFGNGGEDERHGAAEDVALTFLHV